MICRSGAHQEQIVDPGLEQLILLAAAGWEAASSCWTGLQHHCQCSFATRAVALQVASFCQIDLPGYCWDRLLVPSCFMRHLNFWKKHAITAVRKSWPNYLMALSLQKVPRGDHAGGESMSQLQNRGCQQVRHPRALHRCTVD